ncbi:MAG: YidC/Oxa1 family membrane protein insertase [Dehalococcoidia bacterium]
MLLWDLIFVNPITNALIILNNIVLGNFGVAIILFTIIMRLLTMPLTMRQIRSSRALSTLQPKLQELQKKYKDPKRRQEETMKLYREAGVNPLGCLLPMLVQFPIWIALYRALRITVGGTPESVVGLSQRLYPWSYIEQAVPLENTFLWMDLGQPDTSLILALIVFASTYVQQRLATPPTTDPRTQSTNQMMLWMMPLMFAFFTLQVPSGLGVYWAMSNIVGVIMYYFVQGPQQVSWRTVLLPPATAPARPQASHRDQSPAKDKEPTAQPAEAALPTGSKRKKRSSHGRSRGKRKDRR